MSDPERRKGSIVIALDPNAPGYTGLQILRAVLGRAGLELLGLYVEDIDLLEHARSRLATEVVLWGVTRPLESTKLERQLRLQSLKIRGIFEREAARLGLPHAFKVLRGHVASELATAAADTEMLVIELPQPTAGVQAIWVNRIEQISAADIPAVLYVREGGSEGDTVLAIIDLPSDVETTIRAALALTRASESALTALLSVHAQTDEAAVRAALEAVLPRDRLRVERLSEQDMVASAVGYVARASTRALVAPTRLAAGDTRLVRELLQQTRCSIMLVGGHGRERPRQPTEPPTWGGLLKADGA